MAVIIPFGDPNARGTVGRTITFRRFFGRVVATTKTEPKQPNTQLQKDWREWMRQANVDYNGMAEYSKDFCRRRGRELNMTGKNRWIQQYFTVGIPMYNAPQWLTVKAVNITVPRSGIPDGIQIELLAKEYQDNTYHSVGTIKDRECLWTPTGFSPSVTWFWKLIVTNQIVVPFGYGIECLVGYQWSADKRKTVRFPELAIGTHEYHWADDGSLYLDETPYNYNFVASDLI